MATLDDLIAMNTAGYNINALGQVMGAVSHLSYGLTARRGEEFQAAQLRQEAGNAAASGQRSAADVQLQSQYIASRALAVAAASGGGASDPSVVNLMAKNAQVGAYKQSVALYQGADRSRALNLQASAKEYTGKEIAFNSEQVAAGQLFRAGTTLMARDASNSSLFKKYGAGAPASGPMGALIPDLWSENGPGE